MRPAALGVLALVISTCVVLVGPDRVVAASGCSVEVGWRRGSSKCVREPQRVAPVARSARGSGRQSMRRSEPVCALRVSGTCVSGVRCADAAGRAGNYFVLYGEGVKRPGRACLPGARRAAAAAPAPPVLSAGLVATAMRRLAWRVPRLTVQPPGGATLVNLATNVFARGDRVQTLTTQLLTRRVPIEARAVRYEWSFGDGARLSTAQPGRPYPALDVTHRYPAPGRFRLTLATSFTGRFRVDDGPWRPVPGELRLVAPAQPLRVVEARPQLRGE